MCKRLLYFKLGKPNGFSSINEHECAVIFPLINPLHNYTEWLLSRTSAHVLTTIYSCVFRQISIQQKMAETHDDNRFYLQKVQMLINVDILLTHPLELIQLQVPLTWNYSKKKTTITTSTGLIATQIQNVCSIVCHFEINFFLIYLFVYLFGSTNLIIGIGAVQESASLFIYFQYHLFFIRNDWIRWCGTDS